MTIHSTHRPTGEARAGLDRPDHGRGALAAQDTTRRSTRSPNLTEGIVPVKQVLRWQDDGGAIFPGTQ